MGSRQPPPSPTGPPGAGGDTLAIRAYGSEHVGKDIARPASLVISQPGTVTYGDIGESPVDSSATT